MLYRVRVVDKIIKIIVNIFELSWEGVRSPYPTVEAVDIAK